ncbi:hypothetical protein FAM22021_002395 [Propionibacterium freudenreichii]|nr:hypothetical protein [Propionibacterium freudenreichii]
MATPRGSRPPGDSIRGSRPPADHPRPTMVRPHWALLEGRAGFAHDDQDVGLRQGWFREGRDAQAFDRTIRLPFPPESRASGIGDTGFHPVVWYRIAIPAGMLESLGHGPGRRLLVHFGAVDHDAIVWVDGTEAGSHQGGQSAFTLDITDCLGPGPDHHIVVRAHDDPTDRSQLRGKQDWQPRPHAIWYERSTGIWRPVWLESVPDTHISQLSWRVSLREGTAIALIELNHAPRRGVPVTVTLGLGGKPIAATRATLRERAGRIRVSIPHARRWAWSPANPQLLDATISAGDDRVTSYVGMRDVSVGTRRLEINGQPTYLRQVLEQCYWPDSLYTPPDVQALDDELALIAGLGFNGLRIHQQTPDPRLLYRADRAGLLVFAEIGNAWSTPRSRPAGCAANGATRCWPPAATRASCAGCRSTSRGACRGSPTTPNRPPSPRRWPRSPATSTRPGQPYPTTAGSTSTPTCSPSTTTRPAPWCCVAAIATRASNDCAPATRWARRLVSSCWATNNAPSYRCCSTNVAACASPPARPAAVAAGAIRRCAPRGASVVASPRS